MYCLVHLEKNEHSITYIEIAKESISLCVGKCTQERERDLRFFVRGVCDKCLLNQTQVASYPCCRRMSALFGSIRCIRKFS
jgi:hypothetical protein